MAGEIFGSAEFIVRAVGDFQATFNQISRLEAQIRNLSSVGGQVDLAPQFKDALASLSKDLEGAFSKLGERSKDFDLVPNISSAQQALQGYMRTIDAAIVENEKFNQSLALHSQGFPAFVQTEAQAKTYIATMERAIAENEKFNQSLALSKQGFPTFVQTQQQAQGYISTLERATAENVKFNESLALQKQGFPAFVQTQQQAQSYISTLNAATEENKKFDAAQSQSGKGTSAFGQALGQLRGFFGISAEGSSLLSGALTALATVGVFTAIGAIIGLGNALLQVFTKDVPAAIAAADSLQVMELRIKDIFGAASKDVLDFANTTALNLGETQKEAAGAAAAFGNAFQQIGVGGRQAAEFGIALTQAAAAIRFTSQGTVPLAQALKDVNAALEGNVRVLRNYDIVTSQAALKQTILRDTGLEVKGSLTEEQTAFAAALTIIDSAIQRQGQLAAQNQSLGQEFTTLRASITDIGTAFGALLLPVVKEIVGVFSDFFFIIAKGVTALESFAGSSRAAGAAFQVIHVALIPLLAPLELLSKALDFAARHLGKNKQETDSLAEAKQKLAQQFLASARAAATEGAALQTNIDALNKVSEAIRKGLEDISNARTRINRAVFDSEVRLADVQIENARRIADATQNAIRAEEDLVHAQAEAARRIADANQAVTDATSKAADDNKKAQNRIDDENRRHTRSVEDLSLRIKAAKEQEAKAFLDAELAVEAALRKGNGEAFNAAEIRLFEAKKSSGATGSLATAERELAREQEDHARKLKELTDDATKTRIDGQKAIQKAVRDRTRAEQDADFNIRRAQEQVNKAVEDERRAHEDALRALQKVVIENNRAVVDAQRGLADATRSANDSVRTARENVDKLAAALGLTADQFRLLIEEAIVFKSEMANFPGGGGGEFGGHGASGGFAVGGDFSGGVPILVGERGPELIIPRTSGTVVSNDDLVKLLRQLTNGKGNGSPNIVINEVASDPRATAWAVSQELAKGVS